MRNSAPTARSFGCDPPFIGSPQDSHTRRVIQQIHIQLYLLSVRGEINSFKDIKATSESFHSIQKDPPSFGVACPDWPNHAGVRPKR